MSEHIAEISNTFSTGGGGVNFENRVQSVFALSLIFDGFVPEIPWPIRELHFQAKRLGYDTDDLVVETSISSGKRARLLCQMKHDIVVTNAKTNPVFQEVINAAWSDYKKKSFDNKYDRIALITGLITKPNMEALYTIHEQARSKRDARSFLMHMGQDQVIKQSTRDKFRILRECLKKANNGTELSEDELWGFCRCFFLCVFDIEYYSSINRFLIKSLIRRKFVSDNHDDISLVWGALIAECAEWDYRGADIGVDDIPEEILKKFDKASLETQSPVEVKLTDEAEAVNDPFRLFRNEDHWEILALLGNWDDSNTNDQDAIERLAKCKYSEFRNRIQRLVITYPDFISHRDSIWGVKKRREIFEATADSLFDDTIQTAFTIVEKQLCEKNRRFDLNDEFQMMIPSDGCFSHSSKMRGGLLEGLCIIANHIPLKNCSYDLVQRLSGKLIYNVFHGCQWTRLASISDLLPTLAEMSPKTYLSQLETFMEDYPAEMRKVFPKCEDNFLFNPNFMTPILRSLEILAWSEDYLVQCIRCLGALENLGYEETNHANTPVASIVNTLFPYYLQTCASVEKQKNAVKALKTDYQDVCWDVLLKILPIGGPSYAYKTVHPRFLQMEIPEQIALSQKDKGELLLFYSQLACDLAESDCRRNLDLVQRLRYMNLEMRIKVLVRVSSLAPQWNDDEKNMVWVQLRKLLPRAKTDQIKKENTKLFTALENAVATTEPESVVYQYQQKFLERSEDYEENEVHQQQIVKEIYLEYGIPMLIRLSDSMDGEYNIASILGNIIKPDELCVILPEYQSGKNTQFYSSLVRSYFWKNGVEALDGMALHSYPQEFRVTILLDMPFTNRLMQLVPSYLPDMESLFWQKVNVPVYSEKYSDYDIKTVVRKYLGCGRAVAAVNLFGYRCGDPGIADDLIYQLLNAALESPQQNMLKNYSCQSLIKYLQDTPNRNMIALSSIEFAYYPFLKAGSEVTTRALNYRLSNEPALFCKVMELLYKKRHETKDCEKANTVPNNILRRLYEIMFGYQIIPGVDWNGEFHGDAFEKWFDEVEVWARENDRYEVAMHTIGNGLAYAAFDENGLLHPAIMGVLNKPQNKELRTGYEIGVSNSRGAYCVDPEGKPEFALAETYKKRAEAVETMGYSRFADSLNSIAEKYVEEAREHIREFNSSEEQYDNSITDE